MDHNAQQLLNHLCREYQHLSESVLSRPFPEFSETIKSKYGYCYVRCPVGSQRFSIVAVNFTQSVRGQGVFTAFIDYIKRNPHHYQGLEVAIIENKRLAKGLLAKGWQYKSLLSKWLLPSKPTLIHDF